MLQLFNFTVVFLMFYTFPMPVLGAASNPTAAFGKLVAGVAKCFGKVAGVDMNKFKHIWTAAHNLDKLSPEEMVWTAFKTVSSAAGLSNVYLLLATGEVIKIVVKVSTSGGPAGVGTAYTVDAIGEGLLQAC